MFTLTILKDVLKGSKKLLKLSESAMIPHIPKLPEMDIKLLWKDIRQDDKMAQYFPEIYVKRKSTPNRNFFFIV